MMPRLLIIVTLTLLSSCTEHDTENLEKSADNVTRAISGQIEEIQQSYLNSDDAQDLLKGETAAKMDESLKQYRNEFCSQIGSLHKKDLKGEEEDRSFSSRAARVDCRKLVDKGLLGPIKLKREVLAELAKVLPPKEGVEEKNKPNQDKSE